MVRDVIWKTEYATIIRFGGIMFLLESLQEKQKTWKQITTSWLNQHGLY